MHEPAESPRLEPLILLFVFAILVWAMPGQATPASPGCKVLVDALAPATPETTFSVWASHGPTIDRNQFVGPEFTLDRPAVLSEVGGFLANCIGPDPNCPEINDFEVQIRPAIPGGPDPSVILARFPLSNDGDPEITSYESVRMQLSLPAGTYFAIFAPIEGSWGYLLEFAGIPFPYQPGPVRMGVLPWTTLAGVFPEVPMAVRVLADCLRPVRIDIRPGGSPNSINPRSRGVIAVAILSADGFDATTVDPETVRFGAQGQEAAPVHYSLEQVDQDGDLDLVLHFRTQETGIACGATRASLSGETYDGQALGGSDSVRTVGCR